MKRCHSSLRCEAVAQPNSYAHVPFIHLSPPNIEKHVWYNHIRCWPPNDVTDIDSRLPLDPVVEINLQAWKVICPRSSLAFLDSLVNFFLYIERQKYNLSGIRSHAMMGCRIGKWGNSYLTSGLGFVITDAHKLSLVNDRFIFILSYFIRIQPLPDYYSCNFEHMKHN